MLYLVLKHYEKSKTADTYLEILNFLAKNHQLYFDIDTIRFFVSRFGKTFIREFYPGGFEDRFKGRACYLYKLNKKDFSYETEYIELVSTKPVKVGEWKLNKCASLWGACMS